MRRLIKVLLLVLLAVGMTYGAAKGYLYYRVKQTLDELVYSTESVGNQLEYGAIETDLRGLVVVNDLRLMTSDISRPLTVERVRISGPDALYFLDPRNNWSPSSGKGGKPPPKFHVDVEHLQIPPLDELPGAGKDNPNMMPFNNCASKGADRLAILSALGLDELVFDGEFGWEFDSIDERLEVEFGAYYVGMQSIYARFELADVTPQTLEGRASIPQLAKFDTSLHVEPAFGNKFAMICGERLGLTPDEFKARFITEQLRTMESFGLQLGTGLRFAVQTFVENWGEIRVVATPSAPVGLMSMAFLPPERLMETLNASLSVNNTDIGDLSFKWAPPEGGVSNIGALVGSEASLVAKRPARRIRYENYWANIGMSGLNRYLRQEVRLYTADQPPREGTLLAIRDGTAEVQQRLHGGRFTAHVPVEEITRAQVQLKREIQSVTSTTQ